MDKWRNEKSRNKNLPMQDENKREKRYVKECPNVCVAAIVTVSDILLTDALLPSALD